MRNVCLWNSTLWRRFSFRSGVAYDSQTCQSTCGGHCVRGVGKFGRSNGDGQGRWGRPWRWRPWRWREKFLGRGGGKNLGGRLLARGGQLGGGENCHAHDKFPEAEGAAAPTPPKAVQHPMRPLGGWGEGDH